VGRGADEMFPFLEDLFAGLFRVADDIKETTAKAGITALNSLSNITVRICDAEFTDPAQVSKVLHVLLPLLFQKGMVSPVPEIKKFSVILVNKIMKVARACLRPHIAEAIDVLLQSLSSLESAELCVFTLFFPQAPTPL